MSQRKEKPELTDLEKADCLTGKMMGGIALKAPGWGGGKRRRFVFADRNSCYHVLSKVAGGDFLFGDIEKEAFRKLMRRMERFSGVEVLTYAVMGNHFHLLLRVPEREKFLRKFKKGTKLEQEERLFDHLRLLYSRAYLTQLKAELDVMTEKKMDDLYRKTIEGYLGRLCSLEHFMKELKERFSRWFNKRHGRRGTLWQERYRSVLVEDGEALRTMAAYIDLNPVRAGLVDDPKDYRWCGYAEALGGSKRARRALCMIQGMTVATWETNARKSYRRLLLGTGIEAGEKSNEVEARQGRKYRRRGMDRAKSLAELLDGKTLSKADLLRCRVRYFSDGLVLGSRDFVEKAFEEKREWFGAKRKSGARGIPIQEGNLFSLQDLKVKALE
ncbi:transposase [bacterium]|nr:transposase [bacterium]